MLRTSRGGLTSSDESPATNPPGAGGSGEAATLRGPAERSLAGDSFGDAFGVTCGVTCGVTFGDAVGDGLAPLLWEGFSGSVGSPGGLGGEGRSDGVLLLAGRVSLDARGLDTRGLDPRRGAGGDGDVSCEDADSDDAALASPFVRDMSKKTSALLCRDGGSNCGMTTPWRSGR